MCKLKTKEITGCPAILSPDKMVLHPLFPIFASCNICVHGMGKIIGIVHKTSKVKFKSVTGRKLLSPA